MRVLVSGVGRETVNVTTSQYSAYSACSESKNSIWKVGVTKHSLFMLWRNKGVIFVAQ